MRTVVALALSIVLLLPATAAAPGSVTLQISLGSHLAPAAKTCAVQLPTPTNAAAVIDAALAAGCIASVEYDEYPGFGRYVTCVDEICAQARTYWAFYVNEKQPSGGIDNTNQQATVRAGDVVDLAYVDWYTPCAEDPALCSFV